MRVWKSRQQNRRLGQIDGEFGLCATRLVGMFHVERFGSRRRLLILRYRRGKFLAGLLTNELPNFNALQLVQGITKVTPEDIER